MSSSVASPTANDSRLRRVRTRVVTLAIIPVLAFVALAAWAFSSPVGSTPDEDFHLTSIWCAAGDRTGLCEQSGDPTTRLVSPAFAEPPCFAKVSQESAACQVDDLASTSLVETDRGNFAGAYPPIFYTTMSIFATDDIAASVLVMRLMNAALFVGLMTALVLLLPARHRPMATLAYLTALVPFGLFLVPSVNPSSWAIAGVGIAWMALLGFFDRRDRARWGLAAIFVVSATMAAGARADAGVYVMLGIAAVLFLRFARTRRFALDAILPVAVALVCIVITVSAAQLSSGFSGFGGVGSTPSGGAPDAAPVPTGAGLLLSNIVNVPLLWAGVFGSWDLGWLDTRMPAIVGLGGVGVFVAVVSLGFAGMTWRKTFIVTGAVTALWFIPVFTLTRGGDPVGLEVQPRYLLPLIIMLAGFALLAVGRWVVSLPLALRVTVALASAATQSLALYVNIRRYVTGDDVASISLDAGLEWWWNGVPSPMVVWAIGSLAWAGLVALLLWRSSVLAASRPESDEAPQPTPMTR